MRRGVRRAAIVVAVLVAAGAGAVAAAWIATPPATRLARRMRTQLDGTDARTVPLSSVAPSFLRALVATEDERFYRHHGVDLIGLARAIPYDIVHASFAQGASTLTEQVAKLLYLGGNDHAPWRKLEDMVLAVKLEDHYAKRQILDAYVNVAYFGDGATGIEAASERYFGIEPRQLTLAQASLLAGLPQAPSAYDPYVHPSAARARQVEVVRSLVRVGAITAARGRAVLARPLALRDGARLPAVRQARVAAGPALAWPYTTAGAALVGCGALLLAVRRRFTRSPSLLVVGTAVAAVLIVIGAAAVARSFRTL